MILNSPYITGSLTVTGNITASGGITISGSIDSASYSANADRLDNLDSTSFVFTSSYNTDSASVSTRVTKIEGNYATTGSNVFIGGQTVCGNITSTGTIIAQTLNVQQVTSSIVYSSGSNTFGCQLTDVQQMTGSVRITGSLNVAGNTCVVSICSPSIIGGTMSGTTIYGSTAICGAVICGGATTLTGALSGTSATFSGQVSIGGYAAIYADAEFMGAIGFNRNPSTGAIYNNARAAFQLQNNLGTFQLKAFSSAGADLGNPLTIASTGAATFSGYVGINGATIDAPLTVQGINVSDANNNTNGSSANLYAVYARQKGASAGISGTNFMAQLLSALGAEGFEIYTPNAKPLVFGTAATERMRITSGGNVGIGASTAPAYMLEVSSTGGSQRIRVGTLQNNDNTPRFEAITSNGVSVANSAWLRVNDAGGFTLGQSDYTKAGGDSGNFSCLSSEVEISRITVCSTGITVFQCPTFTPQSIITSGFYDSSNMLIITNDVQDGRKTILNNTPVSIFQICKPAGIASSASYSLLGGQLYITLGLRYDGGYNTLQSITYPFFINSAGLGNISLLLGTPTCLTGFDNTGGATTSFGISLCGASNTTATVLICASKTGGFNIDGSTIMTVSMVANRTALLDEPITVFKI